MLRGPIGQQLELVSPIEQESPFGEKVNRISEGVIQALEKVISCIKKVFTLFKILFTFLGGVFSKSQKLVRDWGQILKKIKFLGTIGHLNRYIYNALQSR